MYIRDDMYIHTCYFQNEVRRFYFIFRRVEVAVVFFRIVVSVMSLGLKTKKTKGQAFLLLVGA